MPDNDSGTITPISVPAGSVGNYAGLESWLPLPRTLLPLPRYASIAGINPVQFMSGEAHDHFVGSGCTDRWLQYAWQGQDRVSRYELAEEIARAERDIVAELGFWPVPVWTEGENYPYPHHYRREYYGSGGLNSQGQAKSIILRRNHFIQGGQRATEAVGVASTGNGSLVYSDEDGDGLYETATITLNTELTDACEIRVFYTGYEAQEQYEIRPIRFKAIESGVLTITLDAWLLFDPDKLAANPGNTKFTWLDPTTTTDFASSADVYRIYNDPATSATLAWQRHPQLHKGNTYGSLTTQTAALVEKDPEGGIVTPLPGNYNDGIWTSEPFTGNRDPDRVIAYYQSGLREQTDINGCWIMPDDLARAVAYMATARIARPLCTDCENVRKWEKDMQEDLIFVTRDDATRFVPGAVINCPFGTRRGEVEAWRIVDNRIKQDQRRVSAAIL